MKNLIWILLILPSLVIAQDTQQHSKAINTGIGFAYNEGLQETGMGLVYTIGWQRTIDRQQRLTINPNILYGGFTPLMTTDQRDQYIRLSSLGCNLYYNFISGKHLSAFVLSGVYLNYTRGLLGDGEHSTGSEYYHKLYAGGLASLGFKVNSSARRITYEFRPLTVHYGNGQHFLAYVMFGVAFMLPHSQ